MTIYTKKGDKGKTGLLNGEQISKGSLIINAIGTIDEANSYLGIVGSDYQEIQKDLMTIGSILAGSKLQFSFSKTKRLEKEIDKLDKILPSLKNFILPGGCETAAKLHFARTLIRRAERAVIALPIIHNSYPNILTFLNRLSDYLFMKAREENRKNGTMDLPWPCFRKEKQNQS